MSIRRLFSASSVDNNDESLSRRQRRNAVTDIRPLLEAAGFVPLLDDSDAVRTANTATKNFEEARAKCSSNTMQTGTNMKKRRRRPASSDLTSIAAALGFLDDENSQPALVDTERLYQRRNAVPDFAPIFAALGFIDIQSSSVNHNSEDNKTANVDEDFDANMMRRRSLRRNAVPHVGLMIENLECQLDTTDDDGENSLQSSAFTGSDDSINFINEIHNNFGFPKQRRGAISNSDALLEICRQAIAQFSSDTHCTTSIDPSESPNESSTVPIQNLCALPCSKSCTLS